MILSIISVYALVMLLVTLINYKVGLAMYLMYILLVPIKVVFIFGFEIGTNLFPLFFLFIFAAHHNLFKCDYRVIAPFFLLYFLQAILIPFHFSEEPDSYQFNNFRVDLTSLIVPFLIFNLIRIEGNKTYVIFRSVILFAILIATGYGLFLMTTPGYNPYHELMAGMMNKDVLDQQQYLDEGIRIFGYVSSTFTDVFMYGIFLLMSIFYIYLLFLRLEISRILSITLLSMVLVGVLFCGSRSVLYAVITAYLFYCLVRRKFKIALIIVCTSFFLAGVIYYILPGYADYVLSIGTNEAKGSSIEVRLEQIKGCFDEISSNILLGNGYGWTGWYRTVVGRHPIMLSFESILIQIICNNGILGVIIWCVFFIRYFQSVGNNFSSDAEERYVLYTLICAFFVYCLFTGDYGFMQMLIIFYSLIMSRMFLQKET